MALKKVFDQPTSLVLPSDNRTIIRPETFSQGFSQSEIGTWDNCAEKWYLSYNHRLERKGTFEWHFLYGDGVHKTLEDFYNGIEQIATLQDFLPEGVVLTTEQEDELGKWQAILQVQMERYWKHYVDDLSVWTPWTNEAVVEVEFEGIKFTGKIDLGFCVDGHTDRILMDHKTYGLDDSVGWQFRFQFMFYIWLAQKATGKKIDQFWVNGIKKPQLRQGKDESLASFAVRINQAMIQEPEKYFQRQQLHMIQNSMEHFEQRVLRPKIERLQLLTQRDPSASIIEALVRNQNTHSCVTYGNTCQFLPICQHGYKREGHFYQQREHKHVELQPCK